VPVDPLLPVENDDVPLVEVDCFESESTLFRRFCIPRASRTRLKIEEKSLWFHRSEGAGPALPSLTFPRGTPTGDGKLDRRSSTFSRNSGPGPRTAVFVPEEAVRTEYGQHFRETRITANLVTN
jgi:hypothetical protein